MTNQFPRVRLSATGYLNYVVGDSAVDIYALRTAPWAHRYSVYINGQSQGSLDGAEMTLDLGSGPITATRGGFANGLPTRPDWTMLDLIPSAADLLPGTTLASNFSQRQSVAGWFRISNGHITAIPLDYTPRLIWSWTGRNGVSVDQVVSDAFVYESGEPRHAPVLTIKDRRSGVVTTVTLTAGSYGVVDLALVAGPIGWPMVPTADDEFLLDLAHVSGALSISNVPGNTFTWGLNAARRAVSANGIPKHVQFPKTPHRGIVGLHVPSGRPTCAGYVHYL